MPGRFAVVAIAGGPAARAAPCSGRQRRRRRRATSIPAKKPFSQERCASENGALDGMISILGGGVIWFMRSLGIGELAQRLAVVTARKCEEGFVRRRAMCEIGLQQLLDLSARLRP